MILLFAKKISLIACNHHSKKQTAAQEYVPDIALHEFKKYRIIKR